MRWLISQRVRASLPLLETSHASVEEISAAVGFESPVTFRHHFSKIMCTSPSAYRRGFRTVQVARETARSIGRTSPQVVAGPWAVPGGETVRSSG